MIEDILLRHSHRGMTLLRPYLKPDYCLRAVDEILSWNRGTVLLATGFYVAGYAETDGPAGTAVLALALKKLGYHPVILTDRYCKDFFEPEGLDVVYMDFDEDVGGFDRILDTLHPVGMISVERCGHNAEGDYQNMRGISIREYTAPIDRLFEYVSGKIPTLGVGDGGNEIGMGKLADVIAEQLELKPCQVACDHLIIASVSNWGAYGLTAYLEKLTGEHVLPDFAWVRSYLERTVALGSVDGVTKTRQVSVDGYDISVEQEILDSLAEVLRA